MTNPTFTPPPEMVEACTRAISELPMNRPRDQALAAIAVLAPMIAEECAKVAETSDVFELPANPRERLAMAKVAQNIAHAIRNRMRCNG